MRYDINAVVDVVAVSLRRSLLRCVNPKVFPLARRLPFPVALIPVNTILSGAVWGRCIQEKQTRRYRLIKVVQLRAIQFAK